MYIFLSIIHFIAAIFLIIVILLQAGKGHGLTGGAFGAGNTNSIFGTKTASFITKVTTVAAIVFICTSLSLAIVSSKRSNSLVMKDMKDIKKIEKKLKEAGIDLKKVSGPSGEKVESAENTADKLVDKTSETVKNESKKGEGVVSSGISSNIGELQNKASETVNALNNK